MHYHLHFSMNIVPPVAKRGRHALILLQNNIGNFLLGSKHIYPENIYRMIGGGIEEGEEAPPAAARELFEETGLKLPPEKFKHLATITAEMGERSTGKDYTFVTELFFLQVGDQQLTPSDDIQGLQEMSRSEVEELIKRYAELPAETDAEKGFSWQDYGQLYGSIHRIALDEVEHVELIEARK